tara:strand:- start:611 stop:1294 length:684 start_codon:yes stop_codon:yes gene_type:complete
MNKVIEIKNLKKNFLNNNLNIKVLNNVNFTFKKGELVALLGPSGSGKSTFLNLIGLIEKPTSGKIFLNGENTQNFNETKVNHLRQKKISIIFQNNNLMSDFTVLENISLPLLIRGIEKKQAIDKSKNVLKKFGLNSRENHFPSDLSGGEQQRVAIARSVIAETDIILADEPTGNLDKKNAIDVINYFKILKKLKKIIIFATHNRELANKADYKLSINDGTIKRENAK